MSLVERIAAQRAERGAPHSVDCRALGVAPSTFYEQRGQPPPPAQLRRRDALDAAVKEAFDASGGPTARRGCAQLRRGGLGGC